ncbi:hypothetical protein ACNHKD_11280 [Methylocystis sp. JAN1]|uniref:hypothetical protein n=1 Tax=Methylocystis sp. JAN1 TaxID=3397211 RepID=UPI003FA25145
MGFVICAAKIRRASGLLATILVVSAWTTSAQAGFFEDLFGDGGSETAAPPASAPQARRRQPAGSVSFSVRSSKDRRSARKSDEGGDGEKPRKAVFCAAGLSERANPDSDEVRLHDGTLRAGDSLVTSNGILVFKGRAACPHTTSDFVGLAQSRLPAEKRNTLEKLEHTMRSGRSPLVLSDTDDETQVVGQNTR